MISHGATVEEAIPFWFGEDVKLLAPQKMLLNAVVRGSVKDAEAAEARHADVNYRYPTGPTALQMATKFGRADIVEWLLTHGVNASTPDEDGYTPLHMAAFAEALETPLRIRLMQSLLNHGAAVDQVSVEGVTPLHIAASLYDKDAVEFLLSKGADPLRRTRTGAHRYRWPNDPNTAPDCLEFQRKATLGRRPQQSTRYERQFGNNLLPNDNAYYRTASATRNHAAKRALLVPLRSEMEAVSPRSRQGAPSQHQ